MTAIQKDHAELRNRTARFNYFSRAPGLTTPDRMDPEASAHELCALGRSDFTFLRVHFLFIQQKQLLSQGWLQPARGHVHTAEQKAWVTVKAHVTDQGCEKAVKPNLQQDAHCVRQT